MPTGTLVKVKDCTHVRANLVFWQRRNQSLWLWAEVTAGELVPPTEKLFCQNHCSAGCPLLRACTDGTLCELVFLVWIIQSEVERGPGDQQVSKMQLYWGAILCAEQPQTMALFNPYNNGVQPPFTQEKFYWQVEQLVKGKSIREPRLIPWCGFSPLCQCLFVQIRNIFTRVLAYGAVWWETWNAQNEV
jgi:hypothetical protein